MDLLDKVLLEWSVRCEKDGVKPVFIIAQHQNKPLGLDYRIFPEKYGLYGERAKGLTISVDDIIR